MGLAASQARLLMITARKDDVESRLMTIANERLALSRQSCEASENYSKALNATKLTISNGSTSSDLSYALLTGYNAGISSQYLLTDSSNGQVVLSDADAAVFEAAKSSSDPYATYLSKKTGVTDNTKLAAYVSSYKTTAATESSSTTSGSSSSASNLLKAGALDAANSTKQNTAVDLNSRKGGSLATANQTWKALYDAKSDVLISDNTGQDNSANFATLLKDFYGDICSALGIQDGSSEALKYAYDKTYTQFTGNTISQKYKTDGSIDDCLDNNTDAKNNNGIATVSEKSSMWHDKDGRGGAKVNIANMIDSFFTYYQMQLDSNAGTSDSFQVANTTAASTYAAIKDIKVYVTDPEKAGSTGSTATDNQAQANFYLRQYDAILSKGYTTNSSITNNTYMQNGIKNSNFNLVQYSGGSWITASTSSSTSAVTSESDDSAVETAKADYESAKDKLDYKESMLDMQKTNLDTERSALDTEVDSVTTIINKNIERSFKMFQA